MKARKYELFHVKQLGQEADLVPSERRWLFGIRSPRSGVTSGAGTSEPGMGIPAEAPPGGATLLEIPLHRLSPNPYQPRTATEPDPALVELSDSIKAHGLLQPILVTRREDGYTLVAGERRWRAAALAGLTSVPALVGEFSAQEMAESALVENLQRRNLNCLEEAEAYRRLADEFGLTQEALAARVGRSQPAVANKLRLLRLPDRVRQSISREIISEGHARALLMLDSVELQELALEEIVRRTLSVRETEELVRGMAGKTDGRRRKRVKQQVVRVFKDARLFRNSLLALVSQMKRGGAEVQVEETAGSDFYEVHLRVGRRPEKEAAPLTGAGGGQP